MSRGPMGGPGHGPGHGAGGMRGGKPKDMGATVKRLLSYIGSDRYKMIFVLIFVVGTTVSTLLGSYLLRQIINQLGEDAAEIAQSGNSCLLYTSDAADE